MTTNSEYFARREHLGHRWPPIWTRFLKNMEDIGLNVDELRTPTVGWGGPAVTVSRDHVASVHRATAVLLDEYVRPDGSVVLYPAPIWTLNCGHAIQVAGRRITDAVTCPVCGVTS